MDEDEQGISAIAMQQALDEVVSKAKPYQKVKERYGKDGRGGGRSRGGSAEIDKDGRGGGRSRGGSAELGTDKEGAGLGRDGSKKDK